MLKNSWKRREFEERLKEKSLSQLTNEEAFAVSNDAASLLDDPLSGIRN